MIRDIACDVKEIVLSSGYINTHWEYCELIKNGEVTYPGFYIGGGNYQNVFNQDVNGNSYLRKNGKVSYGAVTGADNIKLSACSDVNFVKMNIPFRLVMTVPKTNLADDAFSDELLAMEMIALLSGAVTPNIEGVRSIEYNVTDYDTDALTIWKAEVQGSDYQMLFGYAYIAINFTCSIVVNPACIINSCDGY